jgi:hypothetical protein
MKKRRILPVRSLGAEEPDPTISELAPWTRRQRGVTADLISYKLERSLSLQDNIEFPAAGGIYYGARILECVIGQEERVLTAEPGADAIRMIEDARRMKRFRKRTWCSLPAPSMLGLRDGYFDDSEEFEAALCEVYRRLMREMRDAGVQGHILISGKIPATEADELPGNKTFFFSPESTASIIAEILEVQDEIAIPASRLPALIDLLDEYDVRRLILVDAGPTDFALAGEHFDPEDLCAGGYCRSSGKRYWQDRKEAAYLLF